MRPKVSVVMVTYNHEAYIKQAIEGVLMQEGDFDLELIIGDDCSPDGTEEIVRWYISNHPQGGAIRYFRHKQNLGMMKNFIFCLKQCKGDYIALCDGDDYWILKNKIQIQVELLISNKNTEICFTNGYYIEQKNPNLLYEYHNKKGSAFKVDDFIKSNNGISSSALFYNTLKDQDLNRLSKYPIGDWPLYVLILAKKNRSAIYISENAIVYRMHQDGAFSQNNSSQINIINIEVLQKFHKEDLLSKYKDIIEHALFLNIYPLIYSKKQKKIHKNMLKLLSTKLNKSFFSTIFYFIYLSIKIKFKSWTKHIL